ncbi:MAG: DUF4082 domain-containing protein [Chitinophagaceae bacterium]
MTKRSDKPVLIQNVKEFSAKLMTAILLFLSGAFAARSQDVVNIAFNPSVSNVSVNQTFTVDVAVDVVSGTLSGIDAYVNFDPTYLEVVSTPTVPGPVVASLPNETVPFQSVAFMNANGQVDHGRFTLSPTGHPNADFVLFTITFRAIAIPPGGNTSLTFSTIVGRETNAVEGVSPDILDVITNGTVNIAAACTPPTATLANTPTCNGQAFDVVLDAATGTAPFDLVVNGVTYNNVPVGGTLFTVTPPNESLWAPGDVPASVNLNDGQPIEVGTKFTTAVDGFVRGVRMYINGLTATGTFRGKLYDFNTQTLLGSAFFSVSGNGWQQVLFSSPVAVTAGTTYLVTCYSDGGFYSSTDEFFNSFTFINGNLTAPAGDGGTSNTSNGVYFFGGEGFPNASYQNSAYFVDPVFVAGEFTYNLTSVTGDDGCNATGALQTLNVTSTSCSTLPVSLLNISASANGNNSIVVKWATSNEQNNKGFEVLRSLDGRNNWQSVGFVNGAGDSYTRKDYSFNDINLVARRYYYQLKQIDFDGKYKYTAVVSANLSGKDGFSLEQNFPNPFKGSETTIRFTLPRRTQVQLIIYDMNGRVVKTLVNGVKDAGTHAIPFRDHSLPSGVYFYRIEADGYSDVKKMTVR